MPINEMGQRRNPEPTPEQLREIFASQDQTGRARLLNPPPRTKDELLRRSLRTYLAVATAHSFSLRMTDPTTLKSSVFLIGGVGSAVAVGKVYREHHDVDFLVPEDTFEALLPELEQMHGNVRQGAADIYRVHMLPFYGLRDFPAMMANPQQRAQLEANRVQVDFFVCSKKVGKAVFSGGSYPDIELDINPHGSIDGLKLFDLTFRTVIPSVLVRMKELDAKSRQIGRVDLEQLKGV